MALPEGWPYLGLYLILLAGGLGFPLPEDIPLLAAGVACQAGLARVAVMIAVAMLGVLSGDLLLFSLGRRFGHHIVEHRFFRRFVHPRRLLMAERLFARHGIKILFVGRFLPGIRAMLFMAAGVLKVSPLKFVMVDGLAAGISVPTIILLGNFFGMQIQQEVRHVTHLLLALLGLVALAGVGLYVIRRQRWLMAEVEVSEDVDAEVLAHLPPAAEPEVVKVVEPAVERSPDREVPAS